MKDIEDIKRRLKVQKIGEKFRARFHFDGQIYPPDNTRKVNLSQDDQPPAGDSDDEYVRRYYRTLSNVIVRGLGIPIDYTDPTLFKDIKKFWQCKSLFKDHLTIVDNCIGIVKDPVFNTKSNPTGLDAWLWFDRKLDEKTARRAETGAIDRCSVFVSFYFVPSHEMKDSVFWDSLGEIVDGEEVRLVVTEIEWIREISSVWFGADETAQDHESMGLSQTKQINQITKEVSTMNELIQRLKAKFLEKTGKKLTADLEVEQAVGGLLDDNESLQVEKAALENKVKELQKSEAFAKKVKDDLREAVLGLAKVVNPQGVPDIEQSVISEATYDQLLKFKADYEKRQNEMFPFVCQDCGKSNVARRSSIEIVHQEGQGQGGKGGSDKKSTADQGQDAEVKYYGR